MDLFSHILWIWALCKLANGKLQNKISLHFAAFWGVFPDLVAFVVPFLWLFWNCAAGRIPFSELPRPDKIEPVSPDILPAFQLALSLYAVGHSIIIFIFAFAIIAGIVLINRRFNFSPRMQKMPWQLGGWLFHIILDIPTHSYGFYSTPLLWPLSDWRFNGLYWGTPWFLALNYLLIIFVYHNLLRGEKRFKVFYNLRQVLNKSFFFNSID